MTIPSDSSARWANLDSLLDRLLDGLAGEEDIHQLNQLLSGDVEACRHYWQYMGVHTRLVWADGLIKATVEPATASALTGWTEPTARCEPPEPLAPVPSPPLLMRLPSALSSLTLNTVSYCVLAVLLVCGTAVAGWLWKASHPKEVAAIEKAAATGGREDGTPGTGAARASQVPAPATRDAGTAGSSRPLQPQEIVIDATKMIGQGIISEAGVRQFAYGTGTKVVLQAPFKFGVPNAKGGALYYGKSTVLVSGDSPFNLEMRGTVLTCSEGQYGVDVDRLGEGWIQVFRGEATLVLPGSGSGAALHRLPFALGVREYLLQPGARQREGRRGGRTGLLPAELSGSAAGGARSGTSERAAGIGQ